MIDVSNPDFSDDPASVRRLVTGFQPHTRGAAPVVSIVTPFYNTGHLFNSTTVSVFRQSFQQWEWIIVNDGTNDSESLAVLDTFRDADERIQVVDHNANVGLCAARNTGVSVARADLIVQLDSDDELEPTAIEKWYWCLLTHPEHAFVNSYSVGFGEQDYLSRSGFHSPQQFLKDNPIEPTCMLWKRLHEEVGGYDVTIVHGLEDWDFWLRCMHHGYWGYTVPEFLQWYRRRTDHSDRWPNLTRTRVDDFRVRLMQHYPNAFRRDFASGVSLAGEDGSRTRGKRMITNRLRTPSPWHLVEVATPDREEAAQRCKSLLRRLSPQHIGLTFAIRVDGHDALLRTISAHTPDIFTIPAFVHASAHQRFIDYLASSRGVDMIHTIT